MKNQSLNWPENGLEKLEKCPLCDSVNRVISHDDMVDNVFYVAPGKWRLWHCLDCTCEYLDPRPTPETIGMAYETYYTHTAKTTVLAKPSILRTFKAHLFNGYLKWRYALVTSEYNYLGVPLLFLLTKNKRKLDRQFRHLPKANTTTAKVLDLGCGNGAFLKLAQSCGWQAIGLDPDIKAVQAARSEGLEVNQGDIDFYTNHHDLFDVITMNHVIEHLHQPVDVLRKCHALIKKNGKIWIETPNTNSLVHRYFEKSWRGLETPRHLMLFNVKTLKAALETAGFTSIRIEKSPSMLMNMYQKSYAIHLGKSPYDAVKLPLFFRLRLGYYQLLEKINDSNKEFITISAIKA